MADPAGAGRDPADAGRDPAVGAVRERYDRGGLIAAIAIMIGWSLLTSLPMALAGWSAYSPPGTGVAVLVGYLAVGVRAAWAQLRGRGMGATSVVVSCALLVAGAVVTALASPGGVLDPADWAFSNAGWFALVILWRRRLGDLLALDIVLWVAIGVVHVTEGHADRVSWATLLMLAVGSAIMQFSIIAGARLLVRFTGEAAEAAAAQDRVETARLAAERVHEARRVRYEAVQRACSELLAGLAADTLEPADAGVRRALRLAVGRLRRLVVETDDVPEPLLHELRACADVAEGRGVEVDLQAAVGVLPAIDAHDRRALTDPVMQVLAVADTYARVTVVAADSAEVVVAVVADARAELDRQVESSAVEVTCETEGGQQWVQARWIAR